VIRSEPVGYALKLLDSVGLYINLDPNDPAFLPLSDHRSQVLLPITKVGDAGLSAHRSQALDQEDRHLPSLKRPDPISQITASVISVAAHRVPPRTGISE